MAAAAALAAVLNGGTEAAINAEVDQIEARDVVKDFKQKLYFPTANCFKRRVVGVANETNFVIGDDCLISSLFCCIIIHPTNELSYFQFITKYTNFQTFYRIHYILYLIISLC